MRQSEHTAILFFSRTPQEEARSKRIVSRRKTAKITHVLRKKSLQAAKSSNLPLFHCTGKQQKGNSFGQRLANAIEKTFAKGYKRILIIGNDTPGLDAKILQRSCQLLRTQKLVIGPSLDGGVYLIGLTIESYQRNTFISLAWETDQLQATFATYALQAKLAITRLPPLADIDDTLDFWTFLRALPTNDQLRSVFVSLLRPYDQKIFGQIITPFLSVNDLGCRSLRAPPAYV